MVSVDFDVCKWFNDLYKFVDDNKFVMIKLYNEKINIEIKILDWLIILERKWKIINNDIK